MGGWGRRFLLSGLLALGCVAGPGVPLAAADAPPAAAASATATSRGVSPAEAAQSPWRGEFPPQGPLDLQWLESLPPTDGVAMRPLRYNGAVWEGKPLRIYGIYAQPEGPGPFPALLLIHGGGQTPTPLNIAYFVKRGYACLAFDWSGVRDGRSPDVVTVWPSPVQGTHFGTYARQGRDGMLYQATAAAVRGIDVLEAQPAVDRTRIGVQGVSWGGYLTWLVNGLDPRIKVAVATYGTGHLIDQWNEMRNNLRDLPPEARAFMLAQLDPPAFAGCQQGPILFISGSNDFFGQLPQAERLMAAVTIDHRRAYAANRMHGLDPQAVRAAMAWFDAHLKPGAPVPREPRLTLALNEAGVPVARVEADGSRPVTAVRVDFARGSAHPLLACWLPAPATRNGDGSYGAELPVVDPMQRLEAIAQVTYAGDFTLSSAVATATPAMDLKETAAATVPTTRTLSAWGEAGGWYIQRGVDFLHTERPAAGLEPGEVDGHPALRYRAQGADAQDEVRLATRLPADAAREKGNHRLLEIWTHDLRELRVTYNWFTRQPGAREYVAAAAGGAGWQRTVLRLEDFAPPDEANGPAVANGAAAGGLAAPRTWNELRQLGIVAQPVAGGTPAIGQLRWIDKP